MDVVNQLGRETRFGTNVLENGRNHIHILVFVESGALEPALPQEYCVAEPGTLRLRSPPPMGFLTVMGQIVMTRN